jgi:hypothetical protein
LYLDFDRICGGGGDATKRRRDGDAAERGGRRLKGTKRRSLKRTKGRSLKGTKRSGKGPECGGG